MHGKGDKAVVTCTVIVRCPIRRCRGVSTLPIPRRKFWLHVKFTRILCKAVLCDNEDEMGGEVNVEGLYDEDICGAHPSSPESR